MTPNQALGAMTFFRGAMSFFGWVAALILFFAIMAAGMDLATPSPRFSAPLITAFIAATVSFVVVSYLWPAKRSLWVTLSGCPFLGALMFILFMEMHSGPAYAATFTVLAVLTAVAMRFLAPPKPVVPHNDLPIIPGDH